MNDDKEKIQPLPQKNEESDDDFFYQYDDTDMDDNLPDIDW